MNKKLFDLEFQYQFYLNKVGLKEELMPKSQRIETKRAFMSGCYQILATQYEMAKDESLSENDQVELLNSLLEQSDAYWENEINNG